MKKLYKYIDSVLYIGQEIHGMLQLTFLSTNILKIKIKMGIICYTYDNPFDLYLFVNEFHI